MYPVVPVKQNGRNSEVTENTGAGDECVRGRNDVNMSTQKGPQKPSTLLETLVRPHQVAPSVQNLSKSDFTASHADGQ
jgi:hypothetical protein